MKSRETTAAGSTRVGAVLVFLLASCAHTTAPAGVHRILFIGNSLTYAHDIPGIVQALADSARGDALTVETVAFPDFALVDHWEEGSALRAIRRGGWEMVVLQQGPSSVEANRDTLRMFVQRFGAEIAAIGARTALYSVWPTSDRRQDFPRAIESYALASADVNGIVLPVATAWLGVWQRNPSIQLYSDGLHPSAPGAYVAALVMYSRILNRSSRGLPATVRLHSGTQFTVDAGMAPVLQDAADEATR